MSNSTGIRGMLSKILFVGGIVIILILLAWAVINFVPAIFSSLANVGSSIKNVAKSDNSAISVLVNDKDLSNGERFSTYWQYTPETSGTYNISYDCIDGIGFDLHLADTTRRLICETPFRLTSDTVSVELTAYNSKADSFVDVPIMIEFTPDSSSEKSFSGKTTVTITNDSTSPNTPADGDLSSTTITQEEITNTSSDSTPTAQPKSVVSVPTYTYVGNTGRADLAISNVYSYPNQSAFQFDVYNIGSNYSGNWQFSYTDPSGNGSLQYSPVQISLAPGQGMRFTLSFYGQAHSADTVVVRLDPQNVVIESSENNNIASVVVTGYSNNNNNNNSNNGDWRGDADLVIKNLEVGRMSGNRFIEDDEAEEGDDIAIRFEVQNQGGEYAGNWRFEIRNLPFDGTSDDEYRSSRQSSLRPGENSEIIVEFDNIDEGNYNIRVEVDSDDDVDEEDEDNNDDTVRLEVNN